MAESRVLTDTGATTDVAPTVLELRMRRSWRLLVAAAVPAFTLLIVAATSAIAGQPGGVARGFPAIVVMVAVLGGLIIVPGTVILVRLGRGVPDVRIDPEGIVWGRDRTRDLAIDWSAIEAVTTRDQKTQYLTDRLFVIRAGPGLPTRPRTTYGRLMALANRMTSGSPYAISTMTTDQPWGRIRATIEAHLGRPIDAS